MGRRYEMLAMNLTSASPLCRRAIWTLWTVLDAFDWMWLPVVRTWCLNEHHYGGLTGLNKAETAAKHGEAQVKIWSQA